MKHCKYYCNNTNIKIFFSSIKVGDIYNVEESVPNYLRTTGLHALAVTPVMLVKQHDT